jgi:hypothetical protein
VERREWGCGGEKAERIRRRKRQNEPRSREHGLKVWRVDKIWMGPIPTVFIKFGRIRRNALKFGQRLIGTV